MLTTHLYVNSCSVSMHQNCGFGDSAGMAYEVSEMRGGGNDSAGKAGSPRRLSCALMGLNLPIDVIARGITQGPMLC